MVITVLKHWNHADFMAAASERSTRTIELLNDHERSNFISPENLRWYNEQMMVDSIIMHHGHLFPLFWLPALYARGAGKRGVCEYCLWLLTKADSYIKRRGRRSIAKWVYGHN